MNILIRVLAATQLFIAGAALAQQDPASIEAVVDATVEPGLQEHGICGATVAVVHDGEITLIKGYGYGNAAGTFAIDGETTLFRIASVSKLFVATAVMQLVEEGKLDLDTDINDYLDETNIVIPFAFDSVVTLRHLLTHTAGFEDIKSGYYADKADTDFDLASFLAEFQPERIRPPGAISNYSNWSVSLAGLIVQNVSGMTYYDYVEDRIFKTLGMSRSTIREPVPDTLAQDLTNGIVNRDGELREMGFETIRAPSGAISSTASDMGKFMLAHLQNGRFGDSRILTEKAAQLMHRQAFSVHSDYPGMAIGFIENDMNGSRQIGHHGATRYFRSLLTLDPGARVGVFVATNSGDGDALTARLTRNVLEFYGHPDESGQSSTVAGADVKLSDYTGHYRFARHNSSTTAKIKMLFAPELGVYENRNGRLKIHTPWGDQEYEAIVKDVFEPVGDDGNGKMMFVRDDSDQVGYAYRGDNATSSAYRIASWERSSVQRVLIIGCLGLFLLVTIINVVMRLRKTAGSNDSRTRTIVGFLCISYVAFAAIIAANINAFVDAFNTGLPAIVIAAMVLPIAGGALTIPGTYFSAADWRDGRGTLFTRSVNSLALITSVLFLLLLNYWNLLGWQF